MLTALVLAMPGRARALVTVGGIDGLSEPVGIRVVDKKAYVADRTSSRFPDLLRIYDVRDPTNPVELSSTPTVLGARALDVIGGYAYLSTDSLGLRIIDVSDPMAPFEVGSLERPTRTSLGKVRVEGTIAYILNDRAELMLVDVSDPEAPLEVSAIRMSGDFPGDFALAGNLAYVVDGVRHWLDIVDVSEPGAPLILSSTRVLFSPTTIAVDGMRAYLSTSQGLRVFDVSDPAVPVVLETLPSFFVRNLRESNGLVFGASRSLKAIDLSDEMSPSEVGEVALPFSTTDMALSGGLAFVVGVGAPGMRIVSLSEPLLPTQLGSVRVSFDVDIEVIGQHAYAVDRTGLAVLDVSDPRAPALLARAFEPRAATDVEVIGSTVYVADAAEGLFLFDVSTPDSPVVIGTAIQPIDARDVEVRRSLAFVADRSFGVRILDVSNPLAIPEVGALPLDGFPHDLEIAGDLVFVANDMGLRVADVSDPTAPRLIAEVDTHPGARSLALQDSVAFMGEGGRTTRSPTFLRLLDVSDPEAPTLLARVPSVEGEPVDEVLVLGNVAFLVQEGARAFDVSDPSSPRELGGVEGTSRGGMGATIDSGLVYMAEDSQISIFDLGPEYRQIAPAPATCYDAHDLGPSSQRPRGVVTLLDRFGSTPAEFQIQRLQRVCVPARVEGAASADPDAALTCYRVSPGVGPEGFHAGSVNTRVLAVDAFGEYALTLRKLASLCVPSTIGLVPASDATRDLERRDHFACYGATRADPLDGGVDSIADLNVIEVLVEDRFTSPGETRRLRGVPQVCVAVDKAGEGFVDPESSLTCHGFSPRHHRFARGVGLDVVVENQFGSGQDLRVRSARRLCVPAEVTPLPLRGLEVDVSRPEPLAERTAGLRGASRPSARRGR